MDGPKGQLALAQGEPADAGDALGKRENKCRGPEREPGSAARAIIHGIAPQRFSFYDRSFDSPSSKPSGMHGSGRRSAAQFITYQQPMASLIPDFVGASLNHG